MKISSASPSMNLKVGRDSVEPWNSLGATNIRARRSLALPTEIGSWSQCMRKSEWKLSMNQIVIVLCLFLAGCASHPRSETANVNESDSDFPKLSEEFLAGYLAWRPQVGT